MPALLSHGILVDWIVLVLWLQQLVQKSGDLLFGFLLVILGIPQLDISPIRNLCFI